MLPCSWCFNYSNRKVRQLGMLNNFSLCLLGMYTSRVQNCSPGLRQDVEATASRVQWEGWEKLKCTWQQTTVLGESAKRNGKFSGHCFSWTPTSSSSLVTTVSPSHCLFPPACQNQSGADRSQAQGWGGCIQSWLERPCIIAPNTSLVIGCNQNITHVLDTVCVWSIDCF